MYVSDRRPFSRQIRGSFAPSRPLKSHSPASRSKSKTPRKLQVLVPAFGYRPKVPFNPLGDGLITERREGRDKDSRDDTLSTVVTPSDRNPYFQSVHLEKLSAVPTTVTPSESPDMITPYSEYESMIFSSLSPSKHSDPPKLRRRADLLPTTRESIYTDPETRKVFACVIVPSPVKSGSAKSSRRNTAQRFYGPNVTPEPDSSPDTPASLLPSIAQRAFPKPVLFPLHQFEVNPDEPSPLITLQKNTPQRKYKERNERSGFALLGKGVESRGLSHCDVYPRSHRSPLKSPVG